MTTKPKSRARRKKPSRFYTPIDGWKPNPRGMMEPKDQLRCAIHEMRLDDPWGYWADYRGYMI